MHSQHRCRFPLDVYRYEYKTRTLCFKKKTLIEVCVLTYNYLFDRFVIIEISHDISITACSLTYRHSPSKFEKKDLLYIPYQATDIPVRCRLAALSGHFPAAFGSSLE